MSVVNESDVYVATCVGVDVLRSGANHRAGLIVVKIGNATHCIEPKTARKLIRELKDALMDCIEFPLSRS